MVSMKTFADGEFGAWNNIGCTVDAPAVMNATLTCVLLSTQLTEFKGRHIDAANQLSWKVENPQEVAHFTIEKSLDGINWTTLGQVEASASTQAYMYRDNSPLNAVSYYRIRITALNQELTYSKVISIATNLSTNLGLTSAIYPNPSKDKFYFNYTGNNFETPIHIQVRNLVGQKVSEQTVKLNDVNQLFEIDASNFIEGVYFVNITQAGVKVVKRISVTR